MAKSCVRKDNVGRDASFRIRLRPLGDVITDLRVVALRPAGDGVRLVEAVREYHLRHVLAVLAHDQLERPLVFAERGAQLAVFGAQFAQLRVLLDEAENERGARTMTRQLVQLRQVLFVLRTADGHDERAR